MWMIVFQVDLASTTITGVMSGQEAARPKHKTRKKPKGNIGKENISDPIDFRHVDHKGPHDVLRDAGGSGIHPPAPCPGIADFETV